MAVALAMQEVPETLLSVFLAVRIFGFGDAVGKGDQQVSGFEADAAALVYNTGEGADYKPSDFKGSALAVADQKRAEVERHRRGGVSDAKVVDLGEQRDSNGRVVACKRIEPAASADRKNIGPFRAHIFRRTEERAGATVTIFDPTRHHDFLPIQRPCIFYDLSHA